MTRSTLDMDADELAAELDALGSTLPPLLRAEFATEYDVVRRQADLTSTRVLLAKWRGVAAAEQKDPGISHRVLAEAAELQARLNP